MAQMWNAVKRRVGGEINQFVEALNADLLGGEEGGSGLPRGLNASSGVLGMRSPGRSHAGAWLDTFEVYWIGDGMGWC